MAERRPPGAGSTSIGSRPVTLLLIRVALPIVQEVLDVNLPRTANGTFARLADR